MTKPKKDELDGMMWRSSKLKPIREIIDEAMQYFANKYKSYTYVFKEVLIGKGLGTKELKELDLDLGIPVKPDKSIFSDDTIILVFDEMKPKKLEKNNNDRS